MKRKWCQYIAGVIAIECPHADCKVPLTGVELEAAKS